MDRIGFPPISTTARNRRPWKLRLAAESRRRNPRCRRPHGATMMGKIATDRLSVNPFVPSKYSFCPGFPVDSRRVGKRADATKGSLESAQAGFTRAGARSANFTTAFGGEKKRVGTLYGSHPRCVCGIGRSDYRAAATPSRIVRIVACATMSLASTSQEVSWSPTL